MTYEEYIAHLDEVANERPLGGICAGIRHAYYEVERLRKALEKYGRHLGRCSGSYEYEGYKKPCHCGYEQALKNK